MRNLKGFWEVNKTRTLFFPACPYPGTQKKTLRANNVDFWVETEGKGEPLILIHGGPGGNHCYFHPGMSTLAAERKLVYYDLRGHYMSKCPQTPELCGLSYDVEDIESLRKKLGFRKIDLLGHSYGAIAAFAYALKYPANLKNLVFCSAPVGITDEAVSRRLELNPVSKKLTRAESEAEIKKLYYKLYFHNPVMPMALKYNEITRLAWRSLKNNKTVKCYERDSAEISWRKNICKIKLPMLFIFGKHDPLMDPDKSRKIIYKNDQARVVIFNKSGHDPFTDEPEYFFKIVNTFLGLKKGRGDAALRQAADFK